MIHTLAIGNYRSLLNLVIPFGSLNVITGENASGKSNLYKALRLLSETAQGGVINSLATEGGLSSTFWAGPENIPERMRKGEVEIQGAPKQKAAKLRLGFAGDDFGYSISLGLPPPGNLGPTAFALDPEIKRECIWAGNTYRPASLLVDRTGAITRVRSDRKWEIISQHTSNFESIFGQVADPEKAPEIIALREEIKGWRFYDHFRSDTEAPARLPQLGTRTPVLHHDGRDLAAALQTIIEIGDVDALDEAVADAFPGASLSITVQGDGRFQVNLRQEGLLRPLSASELSDGTLRYLLPALGRLIVRAATNTQVWVVSHASRLIATLEAAEECNPVHLGKSFGQTEVVGQEMLDRPAWQWPDQHK